MKARVVWLLLCAIWGSTWLFIKLGVRDVPPVTFAAMRLIVAILVMVPITIALRTPRPKHAREWGYVAGTGLILLGLVMFTISSRTKEIGIRKILGATVANILSILSKDFLKLVFIAFIIAAPVAWLAVQKWLQSFEYRTAMSWWIFLVSAGLMLFIALLTLSIHTIRAATANPVKNLRTE